MHPFDFILLFFSFIYTVALTHILFAATRMIRHRRELVFSWPHALWMASAFLFLSVNWLSLWDLRGVAAFSLEVIVSNFVLVVLQYFLSALVAPDFEGGDGYDLREFHLRERRTYLGAFIALMVVGVLVNFEAAMRYGLASWGQQNDRDPGSGGRPRGLLHRPALGADRGAPGDGGPSDSLPDHVLPGAEVS